MWQGCDKSKMRLKFVGLYKLFCLKGTKSVISSDLPCKDGFAQFTMVPLKALPDQV